MQNAISHGYKEEWINATPSEMWECCAAVGNPFTHADIKEGDTVLDLGCGAGVDVLVSRLLVGESGKVYGVDITPKMVEIASTHAKIAGYNNVEILESNKECCSLEQSSCSNASDDKDWANCVAGTMRESELIELIQNESFEDVTCLGHTHYSTAQTTRGATFSAVKIPLQKRREKHWNSLYQRVDYTQVFWHQNRPTHSLNLIRKYSDKSAKIIDAGCGASFLVDALLEKNNQNITLLDTSKTSLEIVKNRVKNANIEYIW